MNSVPADSSARSGWSTGCKTRLRGDGGREDRGELGWLSCSIRKYEGFMYCAPASSQDWPPDLPICVASSRYGRWHVGHFGRSTAFDCEASRRESCFEFLS